MEMNLHREITHVGYDIKYPFEKDSDSWMKKRIVAVLENDINKLPYVSDSFISLNSDSKVYPLYAGGACFFLLIGGLFFIDWKSWGEIVVFSAILMLGIFFLVYYFTMPKKEIILSRMDGLITFPGFLWSKNITMRFDDVKFGFTSGGPNGVGGYMLHAVRPYRYLCPGASIDIFGKCYEDLSIITWYMDRNRPLPPGTAFDPYRQKDFERRKAEGFPLPLYPSNIPTPEATPEQQAERDKVWGPKHEGITWN